MDNSKSIEKKFNINANKFCYTTTHASARRKVKKARSGGVRRTVKEAIRKGRWIDL
jgi:hypothetical protein